MNTEGVCGRTSSCRSFFSIFILVKPIEYHAVNSEFGKNPAIVVLKCDKACHKVLTNATSVLSMQTARVVDH